MNFEFGTDYYTISRLRSKWKVNKTVYYYYGDTDREGYVELLPKHEKWNPYKHKYVVSKRIEDVFESKEEAEKECQRRNEELF